VYQKNIQNFGEHIVERLRKQINGKVFLLVLKKSSRTYLREAQKHTL
jgi:hypothetical protein